MSSHYVPWHPDKEMKFYSRYSMRNSQPYVLTSDFECGAFSNIPGMQWVPDFSMWQVNNPDFPSGPPRKCLPKCSRCHRWVGSDGYQFWKT